MADQTVLSRSGSDGVFGETLGLARLFALSPARLADHVATQPRARLAAEQGLGLRSVDSTGDGYA